jgi:hypothetical protein
VASELKGFAGSIMDAVAGSCEHGNEPSDLIILDQLSDYQILKEDSALTITNIVTMRNFEVADYEIYCGQNLFLINSKKKILLLQCDSKVPVHL